MKITVLYFAALRDAVGHAAEELELDESVKTTGDLLAMLKSRDARCEAAFQETLGVRCALDQEMADWEASLSGAREVAFFPPMTGG